LSRGSNQKTQASSSVGSTMQLWRATGSFERFTADRKQNPGKNPLIDIRNPRIARSWNPFDLKHDKRDLSRPPSVISSLSSGYSGIFHMDPTDSDDNFDAISQRSFRVV
jgi:hypothetical protein